MGVLLTIANDMALQMQEDAQASARWTDRTANARQGLTGRAEIDGSSIIIWLYHTMDYGIWLEVSNSGNYAIIMETIYKWFQEVLDEMQRGLGG